MRIANLKVYILKNTNLSNPLDEIMVVGAKATVDGVLRAWRCEVKTETTALRSAEICVAKLIIEILHTYEDQELKNDKG